MPERTIPMILQRTRTLRTTKGHTLRFEANKARPVPVSIRSEAMQIGAVPVSEEDLPKEDPNADREPMPLTHEERREKIEQTIEMLEQRNARGDFTATNQPNLDVLRKESGIPDIQKEERDVVYTELVQRRREEESDA